MTNVLGLLELFCNLPSRTCHLAFVCGNYRTEQRRKDAHNGASANHEMSSVAEAKIAASRRLSA